MYLPGVSTVARFLFSRWEDRRRVRVLMHRAHFLDAPEVDCYFVNVINLSHDRAITITHVGFVTPTGRVEVLNAQRPLPRKLAPDESWETWIRASAVNAPEPLSAARVRLTTGSEIASRPNPSVPAAGYVPGA